jgi:flagellin-like protein
MMKFRENEEAVSPVIGVILMVAITVILAAVIAAFVFGMGSNIGTTKTVAVTASQQVNDIIVTYQGGPDANVVKHLRVEVTPSNGGGVTTYYGANSAGTEISGSAIADVSASVEGKIPAGSNWKYSGKGTSGKDHVVVAAHFSDGSDQVVLDTFV